MWNGGVRGSVSMQVAECLEGHGLDHPLPFCVLLFDGGVAWLLQISGVARAAERGVCWGRGTYTSQPWLLDTWKMFDRRWLLYYLVLILIILHIGRSGQPRTLKCANMSARPRGQLPYRQVEGVRGNGAIVRSVLLCAYLELHKLKKGRTYVGLPGVPLLWACPWVSLAAR